QDSDHRSCGHSYHRHRAPEIAPISHHLFLLPKLLIDSLRMPVTTVNEVATDSLLPFAECLYTPGGITVSTGATYRPYFR
ncbi:uncharacterized protein METZ01_LOCUS238522, partial [marine metagenome]